MVVTIVERRGLFRQDLVEHYLTIAREQPQAAERFAIEVDRIVEDLSRYPNSGRLWEPTLEAVGDIRFRLVPGFKIMLFYRVRDQTLTLLTRIIQNKPQRH